MKKIFVLMLSFLMIFSSVCTFAQFADVDDVTKEWAGEAIDHLASLGVINGYEDGTFRPDGNVTRAEYAKMIAIAFDLDAKNADFDDIADHWAKEYIKSASDVMYNPADSFSPDSNASRADVAYAAAAVLNLTVSDEAAIENYTDANLIADEMKSNIIAAVENGIVLGYEDSALRPDNPVTRAEAAVIVYRALNLKNTPEEDIPTEPTPPSDEDPSPSVEHIYTLYPREDILLVTSVSETSMSMGDEDAYRLTYRMANTDEEYSSLLPADTQVKGLKSAVSQLSSGDVLLMDTAFLGDIGYLYVFASFDNAVPVFDTAVSTFGDYSIAYGKVTDVQKSGKSVILTLDNGLSITTEYVTKALEANIYSGWKKSEKWSLDGLGAISPDEEDTYVFIRYTDGVATEIVVSDIVR